MQADPEYTLRIELTSPEGLGCNYTEIIGKILQVDQ